MGTLISSKTSGAFVVLLPGIIAILRLYILCSLFYFCCFKLMFAILEYNEILNIGSRHMRVCLCM